MPLPACSALRVFALLACVSFLGGCNEIQTHLDDLTAMASGEKTADAGTEGEIAMLDGRPKKASYYQYTDENGSVRFVKNLSEVPAKFRDQVGRVEFERQERRAPTANSRGNYPAAYTSGPDVTVYTTSWCGWCRKTIAWLEEEGVPYTNKDIEASSEHRDEIVQHSGGTAVPVIVIDGEVVRGFNPDKIKSLIGS